MAAPAERSGNAVRVGGVDRGAGQYQPKGVNPAGVPTGFETGRHQQARPETSPVAWWHLPGAFGTNTPSILEV